MTELAGGVLLLLAAAQAGLPGARWPVGVQGVALAAVAVLRTVDTGSWPFAVAGLATVAASVLRWRGLSARTPPTDVRASPATSGAAVAVVAVLVPVLSLLSPGPGMDVLALAVPAASAGVLLTALFGRTTEGTVLALHAAVFAGFGSGNGLASVPPAVVLLAMEGAGQLRFRFSRTVLGAVAVAGPALAALPGLQGVAAAGIAAATAVVHLLTNQRAPRLPCAVGLAAALFGAASLGQGPAGFAPNVLLCGLALNAAGVLSLVRLRPEPLLAAVLVVDASVWTVRGAGLALPAGLAVAAWAALVLLWRRPTAGRLAAGLSAAHGGVALCAVGLGTAAASYAGLAHMAGHLLAQGSFVLARDRRTALLLLAGLPPSTLFVSEWLLLRAGGGALLPVAVVLALVAAAALRWPPPPGAGRHTLAWVAASAVLAAVLWEAAP